MCVLIKNNRPPYCGLHVLNPTPLLRTDKPPYCRARYPLLQTYKNVKDRTGQLLAYGGACLFRGGLLVPAWTRF
jgi:hypothetical protein